MKGSLVGLANLLKLDPADPHYNSQISRVFDVLHHCMNILTRRSSINFSEEWTSATAFCDRLLELYARNRGEVSASLSQSFLRMWPEIWKIIESILVFSTRYTCHAGTRQLARRLIVDVCHVLGHDNRTLAQMISTPDFSSLALEIWSMEAEDVEFQPWNDKPCSSMAAFLDRQFISLCNQPHDTRSVETFLAPMDGDMKSFACTALKHLHGAFYQTQPNLDCVIWNTHIMTVLSDTYDPLRNVLLTQHVVPAITKILFSLTAETPSLPTAPLKGKAISFAFWNLMRWVTSTDGVTWIIQVLEAKLMFMLIQCENWMPFLHGDPEDFLYPFLNGYLPKYSAYRSALCIISKYLTKIQQLGLDSGKSQDIPLWNAWNSFVTLIESCLTVLRLASGGILPAYE